MYTDTNYKTKKALKEAVESGTPVTCHQPGPFGGKTDGRVVLQGPHYPQPHRWYASAVLNDGVIVPGTIK